MESNNLLNIIFKVNVYETVEKCITVGTAFLINSNYALTAEHVVEACNGRKFILESHDGMRKFNSCQVECALRDKEKNIDIAIIKLECKDGGFCQFLDLYNAKVELKYEYETYGYPEIKDFECFYISGNVISPDGRLCIINSTGVQEGRNLYRGVSGAPLVINKRIYGIIIYEAITTSITKPELLLSSFLQIIHHLEALDMRNDQQEKVYQFLLNNCKKVEVIKKETDPLYKMYDDERAKIKDKRNLREKVLSVCPTFSPAKLSTWERKCVAARLELETVSSENKKALLMAVFFPCIDYISEKISETLHLSENNLKDYVEVLKSEAVNFVTKRKQDYNYGIENTIVLENIIFNLIDSCFLSFDSYIEEEHNVL